MVTSLQTTYLYWDLVSPKEYAAEAELECVLTFSAPEAGTYYLIGALYTTSLEYISGTLFGVLIPEGSNYAVNSPGYVSLWELEATEEQELPCKFTFNRSDVILGLFLMRMVGDEPSLDDDEQVGSLSVQLSAPVPPITIESLISLAMVVGMLGYIMTTALKD